MIDFEVPAGALVLVGDGRKALFLRNHGAPTHVELATERVLEQPDPPTHEQGTDRPGRYHAGGGAPKSSFEQTDWHQLAEDRFAAEIGDALNRLAYNNRFYHLVLVAPPKVLGALRAHLKKETVERIVGEIHKDLTSHPIKDIGRALQGS